MRNLLDAQTRAAALATYRAPPVRPAFERIGIYPQDGAYWFDNVSGTWRIVYERGHLPTPGAMAYAYMSLAKGPIAPCGAGFDVQGPRWRAFQPNQAYVPQAVGVAGMATTGGQIVTQPLTPMGRGGVMGSDTI